MASTEFTPSPSSDSAVDVRENLTRSCQFGQTRFFTVSRRPAELRLSGALMQQRSPVPRLRIDGRWLERAGFAIGAKVSVTVERGRLVIEAFAG